MKRGLAGQLARGCATGSSTYGYRTTPVLDPNAKRDLHGAPVLLGKRVEIDPEEARLIVQIFGWYAAGQGTGKIVERLNASGVTGRAGLAGSMGPSSASSRTKSTPASTSTEQLVGDAPAATTV